LVHVYKTHVNLNGCRTKNVQLIFLELQVCIVCEFISFINFSSLTVHFYNISTCTDVGCMCLLTVDFTVRNCLSLLVNP